MSAILSPQRRHPITVGLSSVLIGKKKRDPAQLQRCVDDRYVPIKVAGDDRDLRVADQRVSSDQNRNIALEQFTIAFAVAVLVPTRGGDGKNRCDGRRRVSRCQCLIDLISNNGLRRDVIPVHCSSPIDPDHRDHCADRKKDEQRPRNEEVCQRKP